VGRVIAEEPDDPEPEVAEPVPELPVPEAEPVVPIPVPELPLAVEVEDDPGAWFLTVLLLTSQH
jgi:hypothetical protein